MDHRLGKIDLPNIIFYFLILSLLLLLSCANAITDGVKQSTNEGFCKENEDCRSGKCGDGRCSVIDYECTQDRDCPNGRCVSGSCFLNECIDGESQSCRSACGMGQQLCIGGIWRGCNAMMPGPNGCMSQIGQIVDREVIIQATDFKILDQMATEETDMMIGLIDMADLIDQQRIDFEGVNDIEDMGRISPNPFICVWTQVTGPSPISYGMKELTFSELIGFGQKYLSYFSEFDFGSGLLESFFSLIDLVRNQIILPAQLHDDLIYDAKKLGNHVLIASANGFSARFLKFDQNQQLLSSYGTMLDELRALQLSPFGNDYAVVWISQGQFLNLSRLNSTVTHLNLIRSINLQALSDHLHVVPIENEGLAISYFQTTAQGDQLMVLSLDLQGNVRISPKQVALGTQPFMLYHQNQFYLFFINDAQKLSLLRLDQDLNPIMPIQILQNQGNHLKPKAIMLGDFIYYTWASTPTSHIWLGEIDLQGQARMNPVQVTRDGIQSSPSITVVGDQIGLTWHNRINEFSSQLYFQAWTLNCQ